MKTTVRIVTDELLITLKQTFDDREISFAQGVYIVTIVANKLQSQHIQKRSSGAFLKPFVLPIFVSSQNVDGKMVKDRKYIVLPKSIFDFDMDGAIDYMSYESTGGPGCPPRFTVKNITRTVPNEAERLYWNPYEKPSPKTPYFYRMGDFLFFLGLENVPVKNIEVGLYTTLDSITDIDPDSPIDFPDELLKQLKMESLDIARYSLMVPSHQNNDGAEDQTNSALPNNKMVSVNQQQTDQNAV